MINISTIRTINSYLSYHDMLIMSTEFPAYIMVLQHIQDVILLQCFSVRANKAFAPRLVKVFYCLMTEKLVGVNKAWYVYRARYIRVITDNNAVAVFIVFCDSKISASVAAEGRTVRTEKNADLVIKLRRTDKFIGNPVCDFVN